MKRTKKGALAFLLTLCVALGLLPALTPAASAASAADNVTYLDANGATQTAASVTSVTASATAWGSADSTTWYVVDSTLENTNRITVTGDVRLILADGFTLTASAGITVTGDNSLTIYGQSGGTGALTATGGEYAAGIGGGQNQSGGTITVNGGAVTATGGANGAGIGGGGNGAGGTITVNGGAVTATGGATGAGIGGGGNGAGGTITVNGGAVTATGGTSGAGIGGGQYGAGGTITVNGGEVTANGGLYAAGIGGGDGFSGGGASGKITITGGTVNANGNVGGSGGDGGAGIGGGDSGNNSGADNSISITGGTVTATVPNGTKGAAIGNGGGGTDVTVTIGAGATVEAGANKDGTGAASTTAADVANKTSYKYAKITFAPAAPLDPVSYLDWDATNKKLVEKTGDDACKDYALVTASDTAWGAENATKWYVVNSDVTIASRITVTGDVRLILADGFTLTASAGITVTGDDNAQLSAADTGGNSAELKAADTDGNSLTIYAQSEGAATMGKLSATGGSEQAGIGGGYYGAGGTITVNGGAVTANGGSSGGAGIGGGTDGAGGTITVNGGTVTATGGGGGAGIGGGINESGGVITVNGGAVTANGGKDSQTDQGAAGIGGGAGGAGGNTTINGGVINATGDYEAAGIGGGGGGGGNGGTITINGGTVTATGGDDGAGIGGGSHGAAGGTITVNGGAVTATGGGDGVGIGGSGGGDAGTLTLGAGATVMAGDNADGATNMTTTFASSHTQKYAKITFAPAAPSYTVKAADTVTTEKKYHDGDDVTIAVTVSGADFEGGEFTLTYDSNTLAVKTLPTNNLIAASEQKTGKVKFEAQEKTTKTNGTALAVIVFTVNAKVKTETTCNFTFEGTPKICYNTGENSVEAATVTPGSVVVEPVTYTVELKPTPSDLTLTGDNGVASVDNSKAIDGQDYSVTIGGYSATDYEYAVTLAVEGTQGTTTLTPSDTGVITVAAANITGNLTITVTRTTKHVTPMLEGATGSNDAIKGVDYTATIGDYDAANYAYTVTLTMNGASATAPTPDATGKLTIAGANITGNFTLTVTKTLANFTVTTTADYVTGWTLVTVAKASGRTDNPIYNYDGKATYYVNAYNAYAYLVNSAVTEDEAKAKVSLGTSAAGTIAAGYDVNNTGKVDYSDALLTYRCYVLAHPEQDTTTGPATAMETYLRADVNGDKKADTKDVSAIDANRTTQEAPEGK